MGNKKEHTYTIQEREINGRATPFLTISGQWLSEQGFTPNTRIKLTVQEDGSMLLTKLKQA